MPELELDLSKPEFDTQLSESELWQKDAWRKLFAMLKSTLHDADQYSKIREKKQFTENVVLHNSIYIYGGRGSGKTVFLKNIKRRWELQSASRYKLHICSTIDPTLLLNHDSFTNVVVAQIYNEVEDYCLKNVAAESFKRSFYCSLKTLADGMAQGDDLNDYVGIDKIIKYRSGVQIESLFHQFLADACSVLGVTAIALPIDDVDMALSKAFEVLDVVRRLLSCPLVLPIVSGDTKLYEQITKIHFKRELHDSKESEQLAEQLNVSYLNKIFPSKYRIGLVGVDEILPQLRITRAGSRLFYNKYRSDLLEQFYYMANGEERSTNWPEPVTPREVTQLLSTIPLGDASDAGKLNGWEAFKQWAEQKQHGIAFTNAHSVITNSHTELSEFDINKLMSFSPTLQVKQNLRWSTKAFDKEQHFANANIPGENKGNEQLLTVTFKDNYNVLRSMPPIELHTTKMTVPKITNKTALITLYTHRDYYTTMANTIAKVFFSRAFELLVVSLISPSSSKGNWLKYMKKLHGRPPFYCIHAISPTKYMVDDEKEVELGTSSQDVGDDHVNALEMLVESMTLWQEKYQQVLDDLFIKPSLIPLLHSVFNKVFSQLHVLKEKGKVPAQNETLQSMVRRFEYITVNAFASFLIEEAVVVKANTAQTETVASLEYSVFRSTDRVFGRNVAVLMDLKDKTARSDKGLGAQLLEAIWHHPIFDMYDKDDWPMGKSSVDQSNKPPIAQDQPKVTNIIADELGAHSRKEVKLVASKLSEEKITEYIEVLQRAIGGKTFTERTKTKQILNGLFDALAILI